ncbi:MAG: HEAT repeat domain-containing protein [Leptospiraceae bacterium]|nr:HEAT repeat domain-containing protein [Leptospiraceae bacterium]
MPEPRQTYEKTMTLQQVQEALKSKTWSERSTAILAAMDGNHREVIPTLYELFEKDDNAAVRQTAALALADFGEKRAAPLIAQRLGTLRGENPAYLLDALSRLSVSSTATAVVPYLGDENHSIRLQAVAALEQMNARSVGPQILTGLQKTPASEADRQRAYIMALGKVSYEPAGPVLLQLARTLDDGPNLAATYLALGRIKYRPATPILIKALQADFVKGRENSLQAILDTEDPRAPSLSFPLIKNERRETRFAAAEIIGTIADPSLNEKLVSLIDGAYPDAVGPAAYALGRRKYQPARLPIEKILADQELPDRETIARSLGWLGDKESVPVLLEVLKEDEGEGRYGAAWSLGILGAREAIPALMKTAQSRDQRLAMISVEAIGMMRDPSTLSFLTDIAERDTSSRYMAIDAIGQIPGDEALDRLKELVDSGDEKLKQAAIRSLRYRKEPQVVGILIDTLRETDTTSTSATMIYTLLREKTGQEFYTRNQWLYWYDEVRK